MIGSTIVDELKLMKSGLLRRNLRTVTVYLTDSTDLPRKYEFFITGKYADGRSYEGNIHGVRSQDEVGDTKEWLEKEGGLLQELVGCPVRLFYNNRLVGEYGQN